MGGLDLAIFRWINDWPDWLSPFLKDWITNGTDQWPVRIVLGGFLIYCFFRKNLRWGAIFALITFPIANEICDLLKELYQAPRPWVELASLNLRVGEGNPFGTSSSHAANMAAVATAFWFYNRPAGIVFTVIAFLTGISRIYVGAHYPYQVLLGWGVGISSAYLVVYFSQMIYRQIVRSRNQTEEEDLESQYSPESQSSPHQQESERI